MSTASNSVPQKPFQEILEELKGASGTGSASVYLVSAFPGLGKTYASKLHPGNCLDLDSSTFHYREGSAASSEKSLEEQKCKKDRVPVENWEDSYVEALLSNALSMLEQEPKSKPGFIFLAQFPEVLSRLLETLERAEGEGLVKKGEVRLLVCLPEASEASLASLLDRYRGRGNNESFCEMMEGNFYKFLEANEKAYSGLAVESRLSYLVFPESYSVSDLVEELS